MTKRARTWTCRRQVAGVVCGARNPTRKRKCETCGGTKPKRRRPAHLTALDATYEEYVALNGCERCGICGRAPGSRRLDRDHDHKSGAKRGLLCPRCNRALPSWVTPEWLRAATVYLEHAINRSKGGAPCSQQS